MASAQEVEMLRRQLDELTAQTIEIRQQSSSTAMNAAVTGLTEAVRTMGQSVSKPSPGDMRVGMPEQHAPGKDVEDWDFTFSGHGYARPCLSSLAENSETITNSGDGDSTARTAVCNLAVPSHDAHTEGSMESREESWKQRFRSLQTTVPDVRNVRSGRQRGTVRANHDVSDRFQDIRRGRLSERTSGTGETIR